MRQWLIPVAVIFSQSLSLPAQAIGELIGGDLSFRGTVIAHGCSLVPTSETIAVNFGEISLRMLYAQRKSSPKKFIIELQDCSNAIFNSVTVTFSGTKNTNMTDRIMITPVSPNTVSGIGIGFEEEDGTAILLDTPSLAVTLTDSMTMQLSFNAFVEAEEDALNNRTLQPGEFKATAYYTLNYQ